MPNSARRLTLCPYSALCLQDIVYFADICSLYACRHAPYSSKLGICDNVSPKRTVGTVHVAFRPTLGVREVGHSPFWLIRPCAQVLSKLYESSKVNFSDIGHCANNDDECDPRVRTLMDNMVSHSHKPFVQFLNHIMLYVCDKAKYADELAVRRRTGH